MNGSYTNNIHSYMYILYKQQRLVESTSMTILNFVSVIRCFIIKCKKKKTTEFRKIIL